MIQKRIPKIRRMAPTTAVWNSRMSLKRQGFSSTHCAKLSLTPTRMTTAPVGTDSHLHFSDIKGNQDLSTASCRSEQRRAPAASPNTKIPCCKGLDLKLPRREPRLQDRATLKTSHQGHFEMLFEQCDDDLHAVERLHQYVTRSWQRLPSLADQARHVTSCNLA